MPKAKPTQVIVHRIELQKSERAMLEGALIANSLTSALSAFGSVLGAVVAPLGPVFAILAGVYVADQTVDQIVEKWEDFVTDQVQPHVDKIRAEYETDYMNICNYLFLRGNEGQANKNMWAAEVPGFYGSDPKIHYSYFRESLVVGIMREKFKEFVKSEYVQNGPWKNGTDLRRMWVSQYSLVALFKADIKKARTPAPWWLGG